MRNVFLWYFKGEHWWKTIIKEGEGGYKKISLATKLVENWFLIRSLSPSKFKICFFVLLAPTLPCMWVSDWTYLSLQVLRSDPPLILESPAIFNLLLCTGISLIQKGEVGLI